MQYILQDDTRSLQYQGLDLLVRPLYFSSFKKSKYILKILVLVPDKIIIKNMSGRSHNFPCRKTDRRTDTTRSAVAFRKCFVEVRKSTSNIYCWRIFILVRRNICLNTFFLLLFIPTQKNLNEIKKILWRNKSWCMSYSPGPNVHKMFKKEMMLRDKRWNMAPKKISSSFEEYDIL